MAADALVIQLPAPGERPTRRAPVPDLPFTQARVDKLERMRTGGRWGDVAASTVTGVLNRAAQGDISDWIDLCEHAIGTDTELGNLYDSRISRVTQADYIICPNQFGNPSMAKLAAEFVNEQMGRIEDWHQATRDLLHAIAVGFAAGEEEWLHDSVTRTNYVKRIHFRHGHRFRYDESWQPRLYDQGMKRGPGSMYGEALLPNKWVVHQYRLFASYPGAQGLMRNCIFTWLFGRWVEKFWIGSTERFGDPLLYVNVPANTPESVRDKILEDMQRLANEHVGVMEAGVTLNVEAAAAATKSYEGYKDYLTRRDAQLGKVWLGASDINDPGEHGSQGAVNTRAAVTTDPRMVTDGDGFASSLQKSLFKHLITLNPHKFGCPVEQVPIPTMKLKAADDEVGGDRGDKRDEAQAERGGYTQEIGVGGGQPPVSPADPYAVNLPPSQPASPPAISGAPPGGDVQKQALNGAQVTSLVDLLARVAAGELPRASAVELIVVAFPVTREQAELLMGTTGAGFVPAKPDPEPSPFAQDGPPQDEPKQLSAIPKAHAPAPIPGQTTKNRATGSRSASPFAQTLRRASAESASSSSKQQLKLPQP